MVCACKAETCPELFGWTEHRAPLLWCVSVWVACPSPTGSQNLRCLFVAKAKSVEDLARQHFEWMRRQMNNRFIRHQTKTAEKMLEHTCTSAHLLSGWGQNQGPRSFCLGLPIPAVSMDVACFTVVLVVICWKQVTNFLYFSESILRLNKVQASEYWPGFMTVPGMVVNFSIQGEKDGMLWKLQECQNVNFKVRKINFWEHF